MKRIRVNDFFYLDEFIPPEIYSVRGAKSIALMDDRIIEGVTLLRKYANVPFVINNWHKGLDKDERGLRLPNTRTGAKWSQHKFGRAIDLVPQGMTVRQLFAILKAHEDEFIEKKLITTVENVDITKVWMHCDCRYTGLDKFLIVDP